MPGHESTRREAWRQALRARKLAPPDPAFRERLRALADSAGALHDAYADALGAGLSRRPIHSSEHSQPPYELRPDPGR